METALPSADLLLPALGGGDGMYLHNQGIENMTTAELITTAREMGFRQCGSLEVKRLFITHNVVSPADRDALLEAYNEGVRLDEDDDGQPSEYDEWQDSFPLLRET